MIKEVENSLRESEKKLLWIAYLSIIILSTCWAASMALAEEKEEKETESYYEVEGWLDSYAIHNWGYGERDGYGHPMGSGDYFRLYLDWSPSSGVQFKVGLYDYISQQEVEGSFVSPIKAGYTNIFANGNGTYNLCIKNLGSATTQYSGYYDVRQG
jgi:hypothetical protein